MTMTNEEIVREYRAAKSRMKQIGILADENGCDNRTIVNILIEAGESVPGNFLPRKKQTARPVLVELAEEDKPKMTVRQALVAIATMAKDMELEPNETITYTLHIMGYEIYVSVETEVDA